MDDANEEDRDVERVLWRQCDECDVLYFIAAVFNPRRRRYSPIAISRMEDPAVRGNFALAWRQGLLEVFDADERPLGGVPVVTYGAGRFYPHNPSHFLDQIHVQDGDPTYVFRKRLHNFRMRMED